jgi:hypothetical protein
LVSLPFLAKSVLISCSLSFISLLKFLDFPLIVSSAISLPLIPFVLEKRANDIIEREKQVAEQAKEQERIRLLQAQKQEQERIDREKMRKGFFAISC